MLITAALVFAAGTVGSIAVWQSRATGNRNLERIEGLVKRDILRIQEDGEEQTKIFREDFLSGKKAYLRDQVKTVISAIVKAAKEAEEMSSDSTLDESVKEAIIAEKEIGETATIGELLADIAFSHADFRKVVFNPDTRKISDWIMVILNDNLLQPPEVTEAKLNDGDSIIILPMYEGG